jgi:FHA domain-containing protein
MTLTLRAVSLNDRPLTQPITAHFDAEGGSVGRADHNTLALPDPERHISRQHAEITQRGGKYFIKNVGSANPITVRGQPLARGDSAPLLNHDQIRIGGYLLEVVHEGLQDDEASTVVRHRAAVEAATPGVPRRSAGLLGGGAVPRTAPPGSSGGLGDLSAPLSRSNPFADLLGDASPASPPAPPAWPPPPPAAPPFVSRDRPAAPASADPLADPFFNSQPAAAGIPSNSGAWAPAPTSPPRALLPDDFDPFAPAPAPAARAPADEPHARGAFDDLIPSAAPASIDDLFDLQPSARDRDPLADFMADLSPLPRSGEDTRPDDSFGGARISTDPMVLFGSPQDAPRPNVAPLPADDVPELRGAFTPPIVRARAAVPPPPLPSPPPRPARAPAPDEGSGDPQALWAAFCDGAGISIDPPQGLNPELMRVVGSVLRAAVAGTLQLMMVRATAKHELRAEVTVIRARNNNPLKFSPDARAALEQLLQPPMRGFLAGPAAMTDAMHDLVGHTIGTMAGTRAALEGVLDRFKPEQLEAKLAGRSMLESLLPSTRKARLWELYLQHFEAIRGEAQDDFHSLFGRAFLAAYEQQLDRLQNEDAARG